MKIFKEVTILSLLSISSLVANDSIINSIGINLGLSSMDSSQKDISGSIILGNQPDETFGSVEIYATLNPIMSICKANNMKPYISYTYSRNSELNHHYGLVGVNKYYDISDISLYGGAYTGYSFLKWKYNPLNDSKDNDYTSSAPLVGLQVGADYGINENISLGVNLKAMYHNHNTQLIPSDTVKSEIEHSSTIVASIGLKYSF